MSQNVQTDVAIIGAGPIGLSAIFACGHLGMRCHVIEALSDVGGQCTALYPEKPIYDIPGFPSITAADLIARLVAQGRPFAPHFHLGRQAVKLTRAGDVLSLELSDGSTITARAVIIAAGGGAFGPNRPPLADIERLEGTSVHYWVKDAAVFTGKRIVIAGGGDSAVDWAIALAQHARSVTLVHRRDRFRCAPASLQKLDALRLSGRIALKVPYQLAALQAGTGKLEAIQISHLDGQREWLEADHLLAFFGIVSNLGPLRDFDIDLSGEQILVDPLTMETSERAVFAVGDVAHYSGKQPLIVTGFAEAVTAARTAYDRVFPGRPFHFQHSTDRGAPQLNVEACKVDTAPMTAALTAASSET